MTYRVVLTENAKANLRHYYTRAAEHAPQTAAKWLTRIQESLQRLSEQPERCPLAPENEAITEEVRQFRFGSRAGTYRALFVISSDEVRILHIRRAAMDTASPDELYG
jgi:plasmid stabilization system protein ParE